MRNIQHPTTPAASAVTLAATANRGALFQPLTWALLALCAGAASLVAPATRADSAAVTLTQDPVVFQLAPDEFRIAFGIDGGPCVPDGCAGAIRYRVDWQAEDGTTGTATRSVRYTLPPGAQRTIAVDRQVFDTAEAAHSTSVRAIRVESVERDD